MNTATHPAPTGAFDTRQLWAAVSVLGVAVVALGASLVYIHARPIDGHTAAATLAAPTWDEPAADAVANPLPVTTVGPGESIVPAPKPTMTTTAKLAAAVQKPKPQAANVTKATAATPEPAPPPVTVIPAAVVTGTVPNAPMVITDAGLIASQPMAPAPRAVCASCGRVESVTSVERKGDAKGVGAVAGGVLGAVVGNQVGKGNGRALATILGAVGGGVVGNTIEKNVSKTIGYQAQVRMEDGSLRMVEQASAPAIGSPVIVEGASMRPADGSNLPAPLPQAKVYSTERK
jgi:outer membrane lipoprotein SlyB